MNRYLNLLLAVSVLWNYDGPNYRDVLEAAPTPDGPWADVPGPYQLDAAGTSYVVRFDSNNPKTFFRVRRDYGSPQL